MSAKRILSVLVVLFLIGTASAAVFITYNPEAKLWWSMDKPGPDVSPVQTLVPMNNETMWTNAITMTLDENDDFGTKLRFDNSNPLPIMGEVVIEITCDQGLFIKPDGTVRDFDKFMYRDQDRVEHDGNVVGKFEILNSETIRFIPGNIEEFSAESTVYGRFELGMVGMAYGNYTAEINVVEV